MIDEDTLQSSQEIFDMEMLKAQHTWVGKTKKAYAFFHGVLAGFSLMHLIILLGVNSDAFLSVYAPLCMIVPFLFIVLANLGVILAFSLFLLYKGEVDERSKIKDENLGLYQSRKLKAGGIAAVLFICWGLITYTPAYTNQFYFL